MMEDRKSSFPEEPLCFPGREGPGFPVEGDPLHHQPGSRIPGVVLKKGEISSGPQLVEDLGDYPEPFLRKDVVKNAVGIT